MTLGGGLELCFACDSVQAAAETYSGLVEVGVGLIPGGAGNMNMLWRALEGIPQGAEVDRIGPRRPDVQEHRHGQRRHLAQTTPRNSATSVTPTGSPSIAPASFGKPSSAASAWQTRAITRPCRGRTGCPATAASPPSACSSAPWSQAATPPSTTRSSRQARRGSLRRQGRRIPRGHRARDARPRGRGLRLALR